MATRALVLGGVCRNGHHLESAESIRADTRGWLRCVKCVRERDRAFYHKRREADPEGQKRRHRESRMRKKQKKEEDAEDSRHGRKPSPEAPKLFDRALEDIRPKCDGDMSFTDWETPDQDEPNSRLPPPPSAQRAKLMCEGCPVFDLCLQASITKKPYHGVYAGLRYENGRRLPS